MKRTGCTSVLIIISGISFGVIVMQVAEPVPVATRTLTVSNITASPMALVEVNKNQVPDIWAQLLHPETQPPWWSVPVSSGMTIVGQYLFLGFDLAFKVKERGTMYFVTQLCLNGLFVALALNAWHIDVHQVGTIGAEHGLFAQFCVRLGMLISSGNFLKAMTLWGSLFIQSPKAALGLQPRYQQVGFVTGFPLTPCGANWLNPMKWVYAVVLLPYIIPLWIAQNILYIMMCVGSGLWCVTCGPCKECLGCLKWVFVACGPCKAFWNFIKWFFCCGPCKVCWRGFVWIVKCGPCILGWHAVVAACCCIRACCLLLTSALATIFTLTLWPYPLACMQYWGNYMLHLNPLFGILWIQLWSFLCVLFFMTLYAVLCGGLDEYADGLAKANFGGTNINKALGGDAERSLLQRQVSFNPRDLPCLKSFYSLFPEPINFPYRDKLELRALDSAYENDFSNAGRFVNDPRVDLSEYKSDKIAIVGKTLSNQAFVSLYQLSSLVVLRTLVFIATCPPGMNPLTLNLFIDDIYIKSITERKWSLYKTAMMNAAHRAEEKATRSWAWQQLVQYVWKVL